MLRGSFVRIGRAHCFIGHGARLRERRLWKRAHGWWGRAHHAGVCVASHGVGMNEVGEEVTFGVSLPRLTHTAVFMGFSDDRYAERCLGDVVR